jgi:hypothetical protein
VELQKDDAKALGAGIEVVVVANAVEAYAAEFDASADVVAAC